MTERNSEGALNDGDLNHPCWNELYGDDDDCMASFNSASFVAQDWIKSMPCASGLEVSLESILFYCIMCD